MPLGAVEGSAKCLCQDYRNGQSFLGKLEFGSVQIRPAQNQ